MEVSLAGVLMGRLDASLDQDEYLERYLKGFWGFRLIPLELDQKRRYLIMVQGAGGVDTIGSLDLYEADKFRILVRSFVISGSTEELKESLQKSLEIWKRGGL